MTGNLKLKSLIKYFEIVFIIIITLISFIPFLWLILTSFKFRTDILSPVLKLFFNPTLSNYTKAFVEGEFSTYFLNSLTIATGNVILCLFIGAVTKTSIAPSFKAFVAFVKDSMATSPILGFSSPNFISKSSL